MVPAAVTVPPDADRDTIEACRPEVERRMQAAMMEAEEWVETALILAYELWLKYLFFFFFFFLKNLKTCPCGEWQLRNSLPITFLGP